MAARHRCAAPQQWMLFSAAVACACLSALPLAAEAAASEYIADTEHFPGWKGALPAVERAGVDAEDRHSRTLSVGALGKIEWTGEVVQLAWKPRIFLYKKFLSDAECDHLINKGKKDIQPSEVVDSETGLAKNDSVRTSSGFFYELGEDEIIKGIERRLSYVTFLPVENGKGLQILRYEVGQKYDPHHDFFYDQINARPEHGGQRIATVLMYLTTPDEGGETVFPQAGSPPPGPGWSDCAKQGLAVKAIRGDAVLFYSLLPNGTVDPLSEHGSCATLKGEKYSATKWIHVGKFAAGDEDLGCVDAEKECEEWAFAGECQANPKFMLKRCRRSCDVCDPPPAGGPDPSLGDAETDGTVASRTLKAGRAADIASDKEAGQQGADAADGSGAASNEGPADDAKLDTVTFEAVDEEGNEILAAPGELGEEVHEYVEPDEDAGPL